MDKVLNTLIMMPDFLKEMFTEHLVISVAGVMIFILALMVPGRIGSLLRKVVILANVLFAMAGGFMGRMQNGYQIICLSAISLIILLLVRMIVRIYNAIKQRKIDARIEERALAKAAKRRGSFKKKQGYSGESRETDDDFVPPESSHAEIRQVIEEEINEGRTRNEAAFAAYESDLQEKAEGSAYDASDEASEYEPSAIDAAGPSYLPLRREENSASDEPIVPDDLPEGYFYVRPRPVSGTPARKVLENDVHEALKRLSELRDSGILTDEELEVKKAELLSRIK